MYHRIPRETLPKDNYVIPEDCTILAYHGGFLSRIPEIPDGVVDLALLLLDNLVELPKLPKGLKKLDLYGCKGTFTNFEVLLDTNLTWLDIRLYRKIIKPITLPDTVVGLRINDNVQLASIPPNLEDVIYHGNDEELMVMLRLTGAKCRFTS